MPKTIQPLDDNVLIKRNDAATMTTGGSGVALHLPNSSKEKPKTGIVRAVGPGKILDSGERGTLTLKEGDEVVFQGYAGHEIKINNEEFILMTASEIMGILK